MQKPCIIILPSGATRKEAFLKIFGRSTMTTTISHGTVAEQNKRTKAAALRKKRTM